VTTRGRVTTTDGVEIAFDAGGSGRDVVWLHGLSENRESWTPITERLAGDVRCIRVDFRGHGESARLASYGEGVFLTDLAAVIEATCTAPPIVVGHSLGGAIATVAAALGMAGPVVCVDQALKTDTFAKIVHALAPRLRDPASFPDALMDEKLALGMDLVPEPMFARLELLTRTSDRAVVLDTWRTMLDGDRTVLASQAAAFEGILPGLTEPYLALHGTPVEPEYREWLHTTVPGAQLEIWSGLGHWLHLVELDRFVDRVRAFVADAP
jgi:pimeloyl-ACP methyl ester carboxylesterase